MDKVMSDTTSSYRKRGKRKYRIFGKRRYTTVTTSRVIRRAIRIVEHSTYTGREEKSAAVFSSVERGTNEVLPTIYDGNKWVGRTFFVIGNSLFMYAANAPVQTKNVHTVEYEFLPKIDNWGTMFSYKEPIDQLKPLSGKNYQFVSMAGDLDYQVRVIGGEFDTIALGHCIGDSVKVTIVAPNKHTVVLDYTIDNSVSANSDMMQYPTTPVLYTPTPMPTGSTVRVQIRGKTTGIGTIMAGMSLSAGFTNLVFQNKFIDFSPYEKDQWGNVMYIDGVRVSEHSGTVDLPITDYDRMNRVMLSIGKQTIILNGSDDKSNREPNADLNIFSATMMIGRLKTFTMTTVLDKNEMSEMARYNFTIEEIV